MKIKKLIAAVMAFAMLTVFVQPCFAVSIAEITDFISNPFNLPQMSMQVTARESGVGDYTSSLAVTSVTASSVDYKATLDMSTVRDLFDEGFLTVLIPGDPQLQSEYNSAKVSTTVDVVIDYPATANIAGDLNSVGYLDAGSIFSEKSRNVSGNKVTITYVNRDGLTAEELTANVDTYLKDISFYLDGSVSYSTEGSHIVTVTMSGSTKVEFASKTQTINYYGGSSQITNFSKAIVEHVLEIVPLKPATCDEVGYTESVKCATHNSYDCDINYGVNGIVRPVQLPVLDHKISGISVKIDIPEVSATCASTGVKAHKMCALCKQDFDINTGLEVSHDDLIIPVLPTHTGLVTIPGQDADCIKDGLTDGQKCTTCGKITQVQTLIPALGHNLVDIPGFAPTCYSVGISTGKRCQRPGCGLVVVAQEIIPAMGHNMGEWVVTKEATETEEGSKERVCQNGCTPLYKEVVTIPKLVHVHKAEPKMDVILQAATCTEPGKKQQYCSCGLKYGSEVVIPARGYHAKPDDMLYVSHMPATCSETGRVEHYICPDCNKLFRDADAKIEIASAVIPKDKDNHAGGEVIMPAVKATCTTEGLTEGKKCNKCKIIIEKQIIVDRLWNNVTKWVKEDATCEENGVLGHWHCIICNKDFMSVAKDEISSDELVVAAKGHHYGAWSDPYVDSSDNKTYRKRVCRDCDKEDICEVEQAAHEHNETRWEIIKEATLTETGLMRKVHSCCGEVIEDNVVIPKKEHKLVFVPAVDATCFSEGTAAYWKCQECQKKFSTHDRTQEITDPEDLVLSMLVHEFVNKGHYNECKHCGERVHIVKPNEVQIDKHGGIRNDEDRLRENSINTNSDEDHVKIEAEIIIEPLEEVSPEIDEQIRDEITSENTNIEKVAYDITVEKVTTYTNKDDEDREKVVETDDLVTIIITIPQNMRSLVDFTVHRKHEDHTDIIKTTPNAYGEYIEIDKANWKITLHVKRFSEYAVVGYSEIVNDTPIVGDDDAGPSVTNKYTVKFNTNGGTKVNNVMVNHGSTVAAPETIRDGYTFDGWYTDYELTIPYDFDTPVTYSLTLYAKWIKDKGIGDLVIDDESCGGFLDEGCPHHDYDDIDPEMWYHYGIDFVLDNKLMIGVADGEFAPDLSVTRGMLVTVLYRAEGEPTAPAYVSFDDLNVGDYYVDAVKWAAEHGIVLGYSDSVYAPDDVITREQIAAIMHRYAKFKGFDVSVGETTSIESYDDYDRVSEYAIPSLQYAVGSGLMKGRTETTLNPREDTTRAEMATILYRFFSENLPSVAAEQETK